MESSEKLSLRSTCLMGEMPGLLRGRLLALPADGNPELGVACSGTHSGLVKFSLPAESEKKMETILNCCSPEVSRIIAVIVETVSHLFFSVPKKLSVTFLATASGLGPWSTVANWETRTYPGRLDWMKNDPARNSKLLDLN